MTVEALFEIVMMACISLLMVTFTAVIMLVSISFVRDVVRDAIRDYKYAQETSKQRKETTK